MFVVILLLLYINVYSIKGSKPKLNERKLSLRDTVLVGYNINVNPYIHTINILFSFIYFTLQLHLYNLTHIYKYILLRGKINFEEKFTFSLYKLFTFYIWSVYI